MPSLRRISIRWSQSGLTLNVLVHTLNFWVRFFAVLCCTTQTLRFSLFANIWELFFFCSYPHRSADFDLAVLWYCKEIWIHFNVSTIIVRVTMSISDTLALSQSCSSAALCILSSSWSGHVHSHWSKRSPFMMRGQIQSAGTEWLLAGTFFGSNSFKKLCTSIVRMTDFLWFYLVLKAWFQRLESVAALSCQ